VTGYTVDPSTVFKVSVQYLDTKDFVYNIASGTAGDLASSAGMAADDATAHTFASNYEPCARTIGPGHRQQSTRNGGHCLTRLAYGLDERPACSSRKAANRAMPTPACRP
jgi:hypothetical protein